MSIFKQLQSDGIYTSGLVLIAISLCCFCLPFLNHFSPDTYFGFFIINFTLTAVYFFTLVFSGRLKKGREGLHPLFLFLILFLISAYSLNREMTVFEINVTWFSVLLIVLCINYVIFFFSDYLPKWLIYGTCFLLGVAFVTFLYLSFYLVPLYALSAVIAFVLGISVHTFVPMLFCIYTWVLIKRVSKNNKRYLYSFAGGIGSVIIFVLLFTVQWAITVGNINKAYRQATVDNNEGLPDWVPVAQKVSHGWITEKALKTELVYSVPIKSIDDFFLGHAFEKF